MALLKRQVVHGVFLLADDVGGECRDVALASCFDRETDVFRHDVRKTSRRFVALTTDHRTMTEKRHETMSILDRLIRLPVRVDPNREPFHERIPVTSCDMVCLNDPGRLVGGKVVQNPVDEVYRNDFVTVQDHKVIPVRTISQVVVEVTCLEPDVIRS